MQLSNVEELMKKIGVKGVNVKSGANKDLGSPFQTLSPEGREILQSLVDNVHSQFVAAVAKGRGMNEAQVRKLADGRVFSGAQAKELGLVDQFGTLEDAVELAAKRAGLESEPAVYYSHPEQERWWERIFMLDDSPVLRGFVDDLTRINKGRAFYTRPDRLGEYLLVDYLAHQRKKV